MPTKDPKRKSVKKAVNVSAKRAFKTRWFSKAAKKAGITDKELCDAIKEVMKGQCSDLGGGVFKKRLKNNDYRSIVLAKGGKYWVYAYLFAKNDRENIDNDELDGFRDLAKYYGKLTSDDIAKLMKNDGLTEICDGNQNQVPN